MAGNILAMAGVGFVSIKIWNYAGEIDFSPLTPVLWCAIAGLAIAYGCANLLLVFGWKRLLAHLGWRKDAEWCIRIYGLSQIAKYVPGNIFQFAGRQAMGISQGVSGLVLAQSSLWELALLCISGSLFAVLVIPVVYPEISTSFSCALFFLLASLSASLLRRFFSVYTAQALLAYIVFLAISGIIFVAILGLISSQALISCNFFVLAGAFVIAWLIGLVTPGAPAGIGVREAVVAILLGRVLAMSDILMALMLGRLVTVCGDILFCIAASRFDKS